MESNFLSKSGLCLDTDGDFSSFRLQVVAERYSGDLGASVIVTIINLLNGLKLEHESSYE